MAYVFEADETVAEGCKRILQESIADILVELKKADDQGIYKARKGFKQIRALLLLWRSEMGEAHYKERNGFYRDLAFSIAPLRDAFVLIETLDKAVAGLEIPELLENAQRLRKALMSDYKKMRRKLTKESGSVEQAIQALEAHCLEIETWDFPADKFKSLQKGFLRSYTQGQKLRRKAFAKKNDETFHEWRKAVKSLWYHCRLLEKAYPKKLSPYIDELKKLAEFLGKANDFALLETYLAEQGETALAQLVHEKRETMLAAAKPLGKAIYKEDSRKFIRKISLKWKKWRLIKA